MKVRRLIIGLLSIFLAGLLLPAARVEALIEAMKALSLASAPEIDCGNSRASNREFCRDVQEQILDATVRIRIDSWVVLEGETGYDIHTSIGHVTLKDDRYLVTHNHCSTLRSIWARNEQERAYGVVTLYDYRGRQRFTGPMSDFELLWEDAGTMVIAAKDAALFTGLGFRSAQFEDWTAAQLTPGTEVAQVDWDGRVTRVDWTTIVEVTVEDGNPRLVLADRVLPGASGGGVFWQGIHIANTCSLVEELDAAGAVVGSYSVAAPNGRHFQK